MTSCAFIVLQARLLPSPYFQQICEICCVFRDIGIFRIFLAVGLYHHHQTSHLYHSIITSHWTSYNQNLIRSFDFNDYLSFCFQSSLDFVKKIVYSYLAWYPMLNFNALKWDLKSNFISKIIILGQICLINSGRKSFKVFIDNISRNSL